MSSHQLRLTTLVDTRIKTLADTTANLIALLRDLDGLRERIGKAELARRTAARRPQKNDTSAAA